MTKKEILNSITDISIKIMPEGAQVILFGSQARGDANCDSDWDILVLLNKKSITPDDHDNYTYPLVELGWAIDAQIHPIMYTRSEWERRSYSPLFQNIEKEGITLC
jgi:predicted nucleotidyltransferase